jgi:DNA polymerase-3 subunit epsilon
MYRQPVVYVDIETTGGSPIKSNIIEIGAIRVEDGIVTDEYRSFVNPGSSVPYWITKITGIKDADLVQAPYFDEIAYQLHSILNGAIFIAHNVRFDYSFIKHQLDGCGYEFKPKLLCTVRLSRALYPEDNGHSLEKIIKRHGILTNARHRAFDDALAIKDFAEIAFKEHGVDKFSQAVAMQVKTQTAPPNLHQEALINVKNGPGVYVFEDEAGRPLYVGKSKQIRKRLLSHFSQDTVNHKEMKLSQSVHNIRTVETKTELEALLLESKMVKELLPIHNRQLRKQREITILLKQISESGYVTINIESVKELDPNLISQVYGVYTSRKKAKVALENKLKTYGLCTKLMGLEKTKKACFAYQLKKCKGACLGLENPSSYNRRLELAMQRSRIESWPYSSAVSIQDGEATSLIVDKWVIIGRMSKIRNKVTFKRIPALFDIDTYRILRSYVARNAGNAKVTPVSL